MFHRGFRGGRRKSISGLGRVVQSYKKVLHFDELSFAPGFQQETILTGVDSIAAGQSTATDGQVPTGSIIKYIEVQFAVNNSVATPCYINCTMQYKQSGQTFIDPDLVGGNPQRNQVLHMDLFSVGQDQNSTHKFKTKVPKQFQRIREGTQWAMVWRNSSTVNREVQIIYKFYR